MSVTTQQIKGETIHNALNTFAKPHTMLKKKKKNRSASFSLVLMHYFFGAVMKLL